MPVNEKEFNGNLFDQLTILDDIEEVAEQENATKTLAVIAKNGGRSCVNFTRIHRCQSWSNSIL